MGVGTDEAFRKALADNGMDFSGSIDRSRAGQDEEAYYVKYPVGTAKRAFLQYHIAKGTHMRIASACGYTFSGMRTPTRSWLAGFRPTSAIGSAGRERGIGKGTQAARGFAEYQKTVREELHSQSNESAGRRDSQRSQSASGRT